MNAAITTITDWFDNRWHLVGSCKLMARQLGEIAVRLVTAEGRIRDQNKLIVDLQQQVDRLESNLITLSQDTYRRLERVEQRPAPQPITPDWEDDEDFQIAVQRVVKELVEDELRITVDFV